MNVTYRLMNREFAFQRPRMAGDSLLDIGVSVDPGPSGQYKPQAIDSVKRNIKSLADITQALTGDRGTHQDRLDRVDAGRGSSRDAAQRMFEER